MVIVVSRTDGSAGRRGWTLIELLVVISIISILGVISIPILRSFARNDMRDGARTVYTMLRAARMYAMTHNVEAAVVYELDSEFVAGTPMIDSLRGVPVRAICAAQVMYRLPDAVGLMPIAPDTVSVEEELVNWYHPQVGTFIPAPTTSGQRVEFPQGYALLLDAPTPEYNPNAPPTLVYVADRPGAVNLQERVQSESGDVKIGGRYLANYHRALEEPPMRYYNGGAKNTGLERLGMMPVYAYAGALMDYSEGEVAEAQRYVHPRMAHIFSPRGNLISLQSAERYVLWFGPSPDTYPTERMWFIGPPVEEAMLEPWMRGVQFPGISDNTQERFLGMLGIPIQIHRATGRVTMGSS